MSSFTFFGIIYLNFYPAAGVKSVLILQPISKFLRVISAISARQSSSTVAADYLNEKRNGNKNVTIIVQIKYTGK